MTPKRLYQGPSWPLAAILHIPAGESYREYIFNDLAYQLLDHTRNLTNEM